jgi:GT2 family glycosyltransferase
LDDDDLLPTNCLEDLHEGIKGFDWVCGNGQSFGQSDYLYIGRVPDLGGMLLLNHIHGGTTMYRRELFELTGGFDEELWTCEEYDFHLKLLKQGYKCNYVNKMVHLYRLHGANKSMVYNNTIREQRVQLREMIQNRYR